MKRFVYINDYDPSHDPFCDNRISNRKYTILNFLPKNLWEQFSRFMNQYFLLIACLQLWPLITPVNPASTWGPLIFIFSVSASKEAWDDYNRYLSDKKANEKEVWVVSCGTRKRIQAQDICVGNIVWLRENDEVPCDLVLIGTSESQGFCFVETAALDGETDLKTRVIPMACAGLASELLYKIKGVIECPNPDNDIRRFDANLRLFPPFIDNDVCPLTINNTLLQSCYLRNTEWACGVAVYTGNETKLGMSRGIPEPKLTAVDAMIDKLIGAIFLFQIVVVVVLGFAGNIWKDTEGRQQWYVMYPSESPWYEILVIPLRFELLCSIMIPISIKVSLDLVKSVYAKFIDWDEEMYDRDAHCPSHATNTAISEDLGQVEYILTDKTGTLTDNKMIFRRCCINGVFYGNVTGDALKDAELLNAVVSNAPDVVRFLTVMSICNSVVPIKSHSGVISYKAQSQDEDALVNAAAHLHMVLLNKNGNEFEVNFNSSIIRYELLDTLEFTSDRKRMSVVAKDCQNGKIILLSKGADEAILPYACNGIRVYADAVEQYAQLGLRTLCLAWRELNEDEYREWSLMFKEANSTLVDREWKLAEVCQRLEHDFEILGVTAIEDRLQDGVPETIETLRRAGINFWMLTGDKQSTAIQIALSCNFIAPEPKGQLLLINGRTEDEVLRSLERVLLTLRITTSEPKTHPLMERLWPRRGPREVGIDDDLPSSSHPRTETTTISLPASYEEGVNPCFSPHIGEVLRDNQYEHEELRGDMQFTLSELYSLPDDAEQLDVNISLPVTPPPEGELRPNDLQDFFQENNLSPLSFELLPPLSPLGDSVVQWMADLADHYETEALSVGGPVIPLETFTGLLIADPSTYLPELEGLPGNIVVQPILNQPSLLLAAYTEVAFVVDGWALEIALRHYKEVFTELALLSRTAVCCRVTPSQKAQLVELLKACEYRTLAIGDGGNDVKMIQQADIGVGISGREGLQAARAADYSIGKFRFLKRLILVHGRYSYNRTAFLAQYSFYKSLLICFIQILFSFISGVSGTSLFNSVSLMAYNVFYTSIPVLTSVLDKDLTERTVMQHPQILFYCQAGRLLNPSTFAGWFGRSLFHAIVVFLITMHSYADERSEMEELSMVALSGCIWLQAFVVTLETNSFTVVQHVAIWGNLAGFYVINFIISKIPSAGMYTIMFRLYRQSSYWTTMFLIVAIGMGPVFALKYFRFTYRSSAINILQQAEYSHGSVFPTGDSESQLKSLDKDISPSAAALSINRNPVCEPLLSGSPTATRRSLGQTTIDFFQPAQSRLSYSRNWKNK